MFSRKQQSQRRLRSEHPAVRRASRFAVEKLEDRMLLSTTTALPDDKAAALRDGISDLAAFADKLETFGGMAKQVPVIGKSVGQVLDLGGVLRSNVFEPVKQLLATNATPTPEQIKGAIQLVLDALPTTGDTVTVEQVGDEVRFNVDFVGSQSTTVPLNLGNNAAGVGFKGNANVTGSLDAQFTFGVDLTQGLAPEEAFFLDLNGSNGSSSGLKASAGLDLKDFQLGGRVGVLDVQLGDGAGGVSETLKASAELGIGFKETPDGRRTIADIQNLTPSALVALTTGPATGGLVGSMPISGSLGSFNASATLNLSDDNLLADPAPSVSLSGGNFADVQNFKNVSPAAIVGLVQQIGASLQSVAKGLNPGEAIPFVGSALNQAVNFSDMVTEMTLGLFDVNLAGASAYTAANPAAGSLGTDGKFTLSVVDTTIADPALQVVGTKEIVLQDGNYSLAQLVNAVNGQLTGTLAGKVIAKAEGSRLRLEAIGAGRTLTIRFAANDAAMQEVGFVPTLSNAVFKFDSLQSLAPLLTGAMGLPDPSALGLTYNPTTKALEFNLKFNRAFNKPIDLSFTEAVKLGAVGELALTGGIEAQVNATAGVDVTMGIKLTPELVEFPENYEADVFPIYVKDGGKVSANATFKGTGGLGAALGILELGINGAGADFSVGGSFTLKDPTPQDGGLLAGEFLKPGVVQSPTFSASGQVTLPLSVEGTQDLGISVPTNAVGANGKPDVKLKFVTANNNTIVKAEVDASEVQAFVKQFSNFSSENVIAVLKQLVGFIQNSDVKLFNEPLPLVNKSIKEMLDFANQLVEGLDGSVGAVKNLKALFFNGGKVAKSAITAVRDAITASLLTQLQQAGGEAAKAGVRLQQAKDQLSAALGSLANGDVQLTANLVSALGLVVQSVAQLEAAGKGALAAGLKTAVEPVMGALPKIQTLKDVLAATPLLDQLNQMPGHGHELSHRLLHAVDALDVALGNLPDAISDGSKFRLPVQITSAIAELTGTIEHIKEHIAEPGFPDDLKTKIEGTLGQLEDVFEPIKRAIPSMQGIVNFLVDALQLSNLITEGMVDTLENKVVKALNDAIAGLSDQAAKSAVTAIRDKINEALAGAPENGFAPLNGLVDPKPDFAKLLEAFDDLGKTLEQFKNGPLKDNDANNPNEPGDFVRNALVDLAKSLPGRPTVRLNGDDLNIGFDFDLTKSLDDFKLDFDLREGPDVIPLEIKTRGTVNLSVGAEMSIDFGVDLGLLGDDPTKVLEAIFFRDTTLLKLSAFASVTDFQATAGLGGIDLVELGPDGNRGTFFFKEKIDDPNHKGGAFIQLKLEDTLDGTADGKISLSNFKFDNFDLTEGGALQLSVPIKIGTALVMLDDGTTVDPLKITLLDLTDFSTLDFHIPKNLDTALQEGILNLEFLIQGLVQFLDRISNGVVSDMLNKLPLIGNLLGLGDSTLGKLTKKPAGGNALSADDGFGQMLKDALAGFTKTAENEVEEFLKKTFFKLLGPGMDGFVGLGLLVLEPLKHDDPAVPNDQEKPSWEDVDIDVKADLDDISNSAIEARLKLGKEGDNIFGDDFDLGFDGLGFAGFDLEGGFNIGLDYTMDFGFRLDKEHGFTLLLNEDKANGGKDELSFKAHVALDDGTKLSANLFFLQLQGISQGTSLDGGIGLDLAAPNKATSLPVSEFGSLKFTPSFAVTANIDFALSTGFGLGAQGPNQNLPNIDANLLVTWELIGSNPDDPLSVLNKPIVKLNDISLDLGEFLGTVLAPVIDALQSFIKPLRPILDVINTEIPVISQVSQLVGQGKVTFLDAISSALGEGGPTIAKVIAILDRIDALVALLETVGKGAKINFGSIDFSQGGIQDLRTKDAADQLDALISKFTDLFNLDTAGEAGGIVKELTGQQQGFGALAAGEAGGPLEGLSFPIFENPAQILNLLFGKDIDLIAWDIPRLEASFEFSQLFGPIIPPFPIFAKIGGGFGIFADFFVGMDTRGLRTGNFLNGIFFADQLPLASTGGTPLEVPELGVFMEFKAGAELNIAFAKAGVEGSIRADINADWNDPNKDGKVHLDELIANFQRGLQCVFDLTGTLTAALGAYLNIEIPLGITSITLVDVSFDIFRGTLFDFSITCPPLPPPVPATNDNGVLRLNIGDRAAERQSGATDIDETIKIYGERGFDANKNGKIDVLTDLNGDGKFDEDELRLAEDFDGDGVFTPGSLVVTGFGVVQLHTGITQIVGNGGTGKDVIVLDPTVHVSANLRGGGGDDDIQGGSAGDTIDGEGGVDQIAGGAGNDLLEGGEGGDKIKGGAGSDTVRGEAGDDDLSGGSGDGVDENDAADTVEGGAGNDRVSGGAGGDLLTGGDGTDLLDGGEGNDTAFGGIDNDTLFGGGADDYLEGGKGDDQLTGGDGDDSLVGGSSNAEVAQLDSLGNDVLKGEAGRDVLVADDGQIGAFDAGANATPVTLIGGVGRDTLIGGDGADALYGQGNVDILIGDVGTVDPGNNAVTLEDTAGAGADLMLGGTNDDSMFGQGGADSMLGEQGEDSMLGGDGYDTMSGGADDDLVSGEDGDDSLRGDADNDTVEGGDGLDRAFGGTGNDRVLGQEQADYLEGNGGRDTVYGGGGNDWIIGGSSDLDGVDEADSILGDSGNDVVLGDNGTIGATGDVVTSAAGGAGADTVFGGLGNDVIFGGGLGDSLVGDAATGAGNDIIVGDQGTRTATAIVALHSTEPGSSGDDRIFGAGGNDTALGGDGNDRIEGDSVAANAGNDVLLGDNGRVTLGGTSITLIEATEVTFGGSDTITGGGGDDSILGGTAGDTLDGNAGSDVIFGDHGRIDPTLPLNVSFTSIGTAAGDAGGSDSIHGNEGDDTVLGGQTGDAIFGDAGQDDLIGGHNVAGGADGGDTMDGGAGHDVIAGDNASIVRQAGSLSALVRALVKTLETELMYAANGAANVTGAPQANPNGAARRDVTLLDHSTTTVGGLFGNDLIAGGADDDTIFGQLGDDVIQGDASVGEAVSATDPSAGTADDGDDYIEGNGGADLIFGDLGQDDIVGGSSSLFGLTEIGMRPDGSDTIFGGSGQDVARNSLGDAAAKDADMTLGDNGNIYRLVTGAGGPFRTFNYDTGKTIVPRAVDLLPEYTPGAAGVGAGDVIHGEAGDDSLHGMTGNDTLFGEGQNDDVFGEQGADWISGGTGDDGVLGDDGKILTSRNGLAEPMYGIAATTQTQMTTPGGILSGTINPTGRLNKAVDLEPFDVGGNDTVYGGLGNDSLHGGAGNDGVSGAEALSVIYANPGATPLIVFDAATGKFVGFVDAPPQASLVKIDGQPLNFDAAELDGEDVLFGDLGNDWLVGGRGVDYLYGGLGNDIHNLDDNLETSTTEAHGSPYDEGDVAFGGGGRDTLLANTGEDRMIDWVGEFNTFVTPFAPFGSKTVNRQPMPALRDFLLAMSKSQGADQTRVGPGLGTAPRNGEPFGELGMVEQQDPIWHDQTGGPTDGQAGNNPGGKK